MGPTWYPPSPLVPLQPQGWRDWWRVVRRGVPLLVVVFGGLVILLAMRVIERPLCGLRRPVTPFVTQGVCRIVFLFLGMVRATEGVSMRGPGALVANHTSWLDIFALNAGRRVYFVAKAEVADWHGIGWLARATGTVFIRRDPREARAQVATLRDRLDVGHRLLFFPEGTSTDGKRVLAFKTTLFAPFLDPELKHSLQVQPVTLVYDAPDGVDPRFYGWFGGMDFLPHLLAVLTVRNHGRVTVIYHPPVRAADFADRKALAASTEATVRGGLSERGVMVQD